MDFLEFSCITGHF